ncbi:MAG: glycosyltransferase family 2 protein [Desulfarculus sp.]|nr:glycosyltransferase family 2 protein [Pseudomonadota bacterium]MBV1716112.1 glycosyltransferase family 2 protein [Desulfarculus sp.]MBU4576665.1 glycosyltransferase family 2 protein [Pseudomonadota bacterium]MBU4596372.1 glycosyltransferase family 2 protein [Pseudomonadota bacterium]MBV1738187.1 glycosyltransferase family 2 protein [Desulfarculus sp.]
MPFYTALRGYTNKRLEEIAEADILIGIPCYNNETTIAHVVQMVTHGLADHYGDKRAVILVADGGSTDDTREVAKEFEIKPWQEKIVSIYRGLPGKGSALRAVFEAAARLKVTACAMVDSDLRSITGDWVKALLDPVMTKGYQYVSPVYLRHKYDGTITNNIVYNLTRALYGKRVRQPIGGDFAISRDLAKYYAEQDVWESEVARFGIDIWMTTNAITQGFKVCQANLGLKVHDAKDPASHLGPMFRQVIWTLFNLMERYEGVWKTVEGSEPVETFGNGGQGEPEPVKVNLDAMIENFQSGYKNFSALWKEIFCGDCFKAIKAASTMDANNFNLPTAAWVQILYELAATYHAWDQHRMRLLDLVTPLYYARVASFVRQSWDMSSAEAEELVEEQAQEFEDHKDYLIKVWGQGPAKACLT